MDKTQIIYLVLFTVMVLLIMVSLVFVLFAVFNKRRLKFIIEKQEAEKLAEIELVKIRIENQENLMKNISWELHDNIGQMLSVSKIQLAMIKGLTSEPDLIILKETKELISKVIEDIRGLSRSLNNESVEFMGLLKATGFEIDRLNRLEYIKARLGIKGVPAKLKNNDEVILFRIIQELMSNVIRHSRATEFNLDFVFENSMLKITADDNGLGMNKEHNNYGIGLKNIISRVKLLNAKIDFENKNSGGLKTTIEYPIIKSE